MTNAERDRAIQLLEYYGEKLGCKAEFDLAIKALDLVSRLNGFKYVTTEVLLREHEVAHFDIYKRGWNDAIQAVIDASDMPVTDIIKAIKENNDAIDAIVDNEPTVERPIKGLAKMDDNGEVIIELLRPRGECKTCKYYHPYYKRSEPRGDGYCVIARMTPEGMTTINCSDEFGCSDYQKCERRAPDV